MGVAVKDRSLRDATPIFHPHLTLSSTNEWVEATTMSFLFLCIFWWSPPHSCTVTVYCPTANMQLMSHISSENKEFRNLLWLINLHLGGLDSLFLFFFSFLSPPNNVFDLRRWTIKRKKGMRKKNQRFSATRLSAFHSGFEPQERRRWYVSLTCVINPESYKYLTPAASAASRRKAKTLSGHFLGRTFHKEQRIRELTVRPKENARQSLW